MCPTNLLKDEPLSVAVHTEILSSLVYLGGSTNENTLVERFLNSLLVPALVSFSLP